MTFYIDTKFALKHYASGGLFFLLFGIISIVLGFKFYEIMLIFMFLGIAFICVAITLLTLNFYSNLTLIGGGFVIGRKEIYGDPIYYPHTMKSNAYMYKIINLNNISITKRYIILTGVFEKSKYFGKPSDINDKLYIQNRKFNKVKIPRIYEKESQLIEEINKFKTK